MAMEVNYFGVYYAKEGNPEQITLPAKIINHRISLFTPKYINFCCYIDKYIYYLDEWMIKDIINRVVKKERYMPRTKEIKEVLELQKIKKEESKNELDWLYNLICEKYVWSKKEKELYRQNYYTYFKDPIKLKYFFRFFGVEQKKYKKYGL